MTTPIPIPDRLTKQLSTRAHRILDRESIQSCQELLKLREAELFAFRGSGRQTVREFTCLQGRILKEYPHLLSHYPEEQKVAPLSTKLPNKDYTVGPADWSLLNRSLPDLCRLSPLPFSYQIEPETNIDSLGLPAADLVRLRSIAVLPEDSIHLLHSLTTGYLIQAGLSDVALSIMLAASARISGPAGVALRSRCRQDVPDVSLYAELSSGALDQLVVPGFRFPALLGIANSETPTVPWRAVARITERTVVQTKPGRAPEKPPVRVRAAGRSVLPRQPVQGAAGLVLQPSSLPPESEPTQLNRQANGPSAHEPTMRKIFKAISGKPIVK